MADENYAEQLAQAWTALRQHKATEAAAGFQQILKAAPNQLDALYGLGLAHRENGQPETARTTLNTAVELVRKELAAQPGTDRFMMLERMLQQRLQEIDSK